MNICRTLDLDLTASIHRHFLIKVKLNRFAWLTANRKLIYDKSKIS